ncbi:PLP-dependent aminotransferase family protein [Actinoplanes sichuanensis]|uniref:PLP-dependent aminotransferase family protein n=1 Tax=Actinoplanes sichuanensis TaxID=512349 RepID=A0ABW4AAW1_9ACTN|nr:PLP-dependent aminotransferase family protein [Actinoplanes sichuanensis]BEL08570.1 PLP-dependent aminotransferase family protein [Actinoplanes sichuanensis]
MIQFEERPGILDLSWGHPRPDLLPVREWAAAGAGLDWRALTYGADAGPPALLEALGGVGRTFVTGGTSHGLALLTQVLAAPGDVVLVDSPTYHLAFPILTDRGLRPVHAPEGLAPDALRALIRACRPRFLYLVPTFGNPTGRSLPPDRRRELIEVARQEGILLVEDDTYRELVYDGVAPQALWEVAGGGPVVRLGSFAKTVAPGLRLGWINAEPEIITRLVRLGYVHSGGGVNHATAVTMAGFLADGAFGRHLVALRGEYRTQRNALVDALRERIAGVESPAGGWFLWVPLPVGVEADGLLPIAEEHGVSFVPGTRFWADGSGGRDRIRLSFSHLPAADLMRAAGRLADAVAAAVHKR